MQLLFRKPRSINKSIMKGKGKIAVGYEDDIVLRKQVSRCLSEMKRLDMVLYFIIVEY